MIDYAAIYAASGQGRNGPFGMTKVAGALGELEFFKPASDGAMLPQIGVPNSGLRPPQWRPSADMLQSYIMEPVRNVALSNPYARDMAGLGSVPVEEGTEPVAPSAELFPDVEEDLYEADETQHTEVEFQQEETGDFVQPQSGAVLPESANSSMNEMAIGLPASPKDAIASPETAEQKAYREEERNRVVVSVLALAAVLFIVAKGA